MKTLAIALFLLAGGAGILGIGNMQKAIDPGIAEYFGTFIVPVLLAWWGKIALDKANVAAAKNPVPTPNTHIRCPDCRELVLKDARVCKHCQAKLVPTDASEETPSKSLI